MLLLYFFPLPTLTTRYTANLFHQCGVKDTVSSLHSVQFQRCPASCHAVCTIWKFIDIKDILHARYEFGGFFCGDAPVVVFVRSKFVFFRTLRIASLLMGVSRMTLDSFSSKRIVHLECSSGTGPQASSISRASVRPSTLRLALSELRFLLNSVTASIPPLVYFQTVLETVARQTPLDFALCSCVKTFPCASSRSRIIWHLLRMVFEVIFLRITDLSSLTSSSVSLIICFLGLAIGITAVFLLYLETTMITRNIYININMSLH